MKSMCDEKGISLLEVLASIALLAVVASGLTASTVNSIRSNSVSGRISAASALIYNKIEQCRALDPAAPQPDLTDGSHADPLNPMNALSQAGGMFNRSWTVTVNTPKIGVSEVVVTVSWNDPEARSVTGVTYVCSTMTCS